MSHDGSASVDVPGSLDGVESVMVTSEHDGRLRAPYARPVIVANLAEARSIQAQPAPRRVGLGL